MNKSALKFASVSAFVVTSYVTFTLVAFNTGFGPNFFYRWLQSWLIAYVLVVPSLLFVAPYIKGKMGL